MKPNLFKFLTVILALAFFTSCKGVFHMSHNGKSSTAPGQVKKYTGSKSAKAYAPGQNK